MERHKVEPTGGDRHVEVFRLKTLKEEVVADSSKEFLTTANALNDPVNGELEGFMKPYPVAIKKEEIEIDDSQFPFGKESVCDPNLEEPIKMITKVESMNRSLKDDDDPEADLDNDAYKTEELEDPLFVQVKEGPGIENLPDELITEVDLESTSTANDHFALYMQRNAGENPLKCKYCGREFSRNAALNVHIRYHTGDRRFQCSQCGKAFFLTSHLTEHIRCHTGERPFHCEQCEKTFCSRNGLKKHILKHTGEKPCKCNLCGRSFYTSCHLANHIRTHTGEKPFKCSVCRKAFPRAGALSRHMSTHTREQPFGCTDCGQRFTLSSSLLRHRRKAHKVASPF